MIKRFFDIMLSLIGIALISPALILAALLIRFDSPGAILFRQKRVGRGGRLFDIYKFRTMVEDAQKLGPKITAQNDPRITQIGQILRWLKFDELPQLFNVLKGDMSLVGPRPEIPEMVAKYPPEAAAKILSVKPGIIGSSQIYYRDEASLLTDKENVEKFYEEKILPDKIKSDLAYIDDTEPLKDLSILLEGTFSLFMTSIKLRYIFESRRRLFFLLVDIGLAVISFWTAFALRFEGDIPQKNLQLFYWFLPMLLVIRIPCFIYFGLYQTLWQYLGIQELFAIIKAVVLGSAIFPIVPFILQIDSPPRSTMIIDWMLLTIFLGASRVGFKLSAEKLRKPKLDSRKNALILGANDMGELLIREYIKRPALGYKPIGFLDDHPDKAGARIHGVKVLGKISQLHQVIKIKKVEEVIIALPEVLPDELKAIVRHCRDLNLPCRIVPQTSTLMPAAALPSKLRPVDVSDLLGRELVQADQAGIQNFFHDKKVLVTGAGGSIGSELCRILFQQPLKELILVDFSENSLYEIEMDLKGKISQAQVTCYLRDVTDQREMEKIVERHKPEIIYHAAAHKHVPLVEANYAKGILNNVLGTKNMADLAARFRAEAFVLISTDKAINPTSIMGTTKRIAEIYARSLKHGKTKFLSVRFGNVFNSRGSVVPLFKKQIEEGGPITITHPDVTRYFMDISEAVFLILQATLLGTDSEIFVLDMGEPVKVVDLAYNLIQLAGLSPKNFPIKYVGLRPGEKLEEELELDGEKSVPTTHKKIRIWKASAKPQTDIAKEVEELIEMARQSFSKDKILRKLQSLVPEYRPPKPQNGDYQL